jgi:hypothetical protein
LQPQNGRHIFYLSIGISQLRPFEFREDHVFRSGYEKTKPLQIDDPATAKFLATEAARFADGTPVQTST